MEVDMHFLSQSQRKKRNFFLDGVVPTLSCQVLCEIEDFLPTLRSSDYYMEPCVLELAARELSDPGYCSRVRDFTVGRIGYGCVKFIGETDVRWLDLDQIVKFNRHEIVVYEDESTKPVVGQGLNKEAEVTLSLQLISSTFSKMDCLREIVKKLKLCVEKQGACFISFEPATGEWKFSVNHFSRFGLSVDDEEDTTMEDASDDADVNDQINRTNGVVSDIDEDTAIVDGSPLSHSLPAHLGLDPVKMKEMKMLLFPTEEEEAEDSDGIFSHQKRALSKESARSPLQHSSQRMTIRSSPPVARKMPLALLDYNPGNFGSSSAGSILMAQQNKSLALKTTKVEGFKLDLDHETPVTGSHSRNLVDAALFMGRSFRVGWGPNGVLVHTGAPVGCSNSHKVLSSTIKIEKIAVDKVVRDENDKVREELIDFCFDLPLYLHKDIAHEIKEVEVGSFRLKLQKLVSDRVMLSDICRSYIGVIEKQLDVSGLSFSTRTVLMHQVMVWELIKVLFSSRKTSGQSQPFCAENVDIMHERKEISPDVDPEALPLIRRAEFSYWLQESVCHRVQEEVTSLSESNDLQHIFLLMTGRQLSAAVELAASRGDVRLACLLSQAGGSIVNRCDIARQLDVWRINGMDFNFIEKERLRLFELLAGDIHGALHDIRIDWKRFLGLLMWYQLPPDSSLPNIFNTYKDLVNDGRAPLPVPVYIDEGLVEGNIDCRASDRFDVAYYLMLLHASEQRDVGVLKSMFSAFASTHDAFDHHMIWHHRWVLEAVGIFSSSDLHILDMGLVSQLLCLGQCHWAIYVVLHIPHRDDYPFMHATVIREILFQYCETWSSEETQYQFIEELGIPSTWMHEALAIYYNYHGDLLKALDHFLKCENWQKAHSIFVMSVAHSLFLSANHLEIWRFATSMENHKSQIEDWDLGAGIYISFYLLRSSLLEDDDTMTEMDTLEDKNDACRDLIGRLNESLAICGGKLPFSARVAYSKMAEEICNLLLSDSGEVSTCEVQLSCFDTVFSAPIPEDLRACHLQDAVSLFTCFLSEAAS